MGFTRVQKNIQTIYKTAYVHVCIVDSVCIYYVLDNPLESRCQLVLQGHSRPYMDVHHFVKLRMLNSEVLPSFSHVLKLCDRKLFFHRMYVHVCSQSHIVNIIC